VAATLQFLKYSKEKPFFKLLFQGGRCPEGKTGVKLADLSAPVKALWKNACSGVTFPWNLILSAIVGIALMAAPALFSISQAAADSDPIAGALSAVVSVVSMAEGARKARRINSLFGLWILAQLLWLDGNLFAHAYHAAAGLLLIALSFRQGPIREKSTWS
jgi:hypothetical protein